MNYPHRFCKNMFFSCINTAAKCPGFEIRSAESGNKYEKRNLFSFIKECVQNCVCISQLQTAPLFMSVTGSDLKIRSYSDYLAEVSIDARSMFLPQR